MTWDQVLRQNIAILICIAVCTASVALFDKSYEGLWSLLLLLVWLSPSKPKPVTENKS